MTARCTRCGKHWIISIQQPLKGYICPYCSMRDKLIQKGILKERKKGMEKLKIEDCKRCRDCKYYDISHFTKYCGKIGICINPHSGYYKIGYNTLAGDCFETSNPEQEATL